MTRLDQSPIRCPEDARCLWRALGEGMLTLTEDALNEWMRLAFALQAGMTLYHDHPEYAHAMLALVLRSQAEQGGAARMGDMVRTFMQNIVDGFPIELELAEETDAAAGIAVGAD